VRSSDWSVQDHQKGEKIHKCAKETATHERYLTQPHNPKENNITVRRTGQVVYAVTSFEQQERGLCAFDDKRYVLDAGVDTLAHDHYLIRDEQFVADKNAEPHSIRQHANVIVDEDGDEYLVVTQQAASPVFQQVFESDQHDNDDDEQSSLPPP
jgi:hypothetical protein